MSTLLPEGVRTGAQLIVDCLELHGAESVFCVPGESYLAVLDALIDSSLKLYVARQEGGAAMMADAYGKLTGRPGICMVTRGPGATNASAGLHIARQDSTPMILFIGQVARGERGREGFQEIDYGHMFGTIAKWVVEISDPARIPELVGRAFHVATSGRPGPVVVVLPEDMLSEKAAPCSLGMPYRTAMAAPCKQDMDALANSLAQSKAPLMIIGGGGWDAESCDNVRLFAERWNLPVAAAFRAQDYMDNRHPNYVGVSGLGINPKLAARIKEADWLLLMGTRMDEVPSGGYSYLSIPRPVQFVAQIHQDPEELGSVYQVDIPIISSIRPAAAELAKLDPRPGNWSDRLTDMRADYETFIRPTQTPGTLQMGAVIEYLRDTLPDDAIITNGAGNYTVWVHRFYMYRLYRTQLAPVAGSMGYGLPSAIAAKLTMPEREVVCLAGDGCIQMTLQELGTAMQANAAVIIIIVNNGTYGTIRMHQERHFPGRVSGTEIKNPDFIKIAEAYEAYAERVTATEDFPAAFERARAAKRLAVIELRVDKEALTPGQSLTQIREAAMNH